MANSVSNGAGPSRPHLSRDARDIALTLRTYLDIPTAAFGFDDEFNEVAGNRLDSAVMGLQQLLDGGTVSDFLGFLATMAQRFPVTYKTETDGS